MIISPTYRQLFFEGIDVIKLPDTDTG